MSTRTKVVILAAVSVAVLVVIGVLALAPGNREERSGGPAPDATRAAATPTPGVRGSSEPVVDPETPVSSDEEPAVRATPPPAPDGIDSFEDCVAAGYPVAESYPRQCFANGRGFTEGG